MPAPHLVPALHAQITAALATAKGDTTYKDGYNLLRWFLKGWVSHPDPKVQRRLYLFHYAHDMEGALIPAHSAQGGAILACAFHGAMACTLPLPDAA